MIRRFNYTDRQKIPRDQVRLAWIVNGSGALKFKGDIDLTLDRPLDPSALIFVEAYSGPVVMRFPCGTVGSPEYPADTTLVDFPPGLKPLFRVKVVDPGPDRRMLAWADAINPLAPDEVASGRRSILPVEAIDLGPLVWKLRVESNQFRLQLNSAIREPRDITVLAREHDFIALVYPAVIRQVLEHLLLGPERDSVDPDHDWLVFAAQLTGKAAPTREENATDSDEDGAFADQVEEWVEESIAGFCRQQHAVESFVQSKKEAEEASG
jgi:hypothetical protein